MADSYKPTDEAVQALDKYGALMELHARYARIAELRLDVEGMTAHRDGLYRVFGWLAQDDRRHLSQVDEVIQMDVDAIVDLRIELASVRKALLSECEGCREEWPIVVPLHGRGVHEEPLNGKRHACPFSYSLRAVANATRISAKGLAP